MPFVTRTYIWSDENEIKTEEKQTLVTFSDENHFETGIFSENVFQSRTSERFYEIILITI